MIDEDRTVEILVSCIEQLLELLKETRNAERAEEIYREFFGN